MAVERPFLFNELVLSKQITKRDSLTFAFMSSAKMTVESPFLFNELVLSKQITKRDSLTFNGTLMSKPKMTD